MAEFSTPREFTPADDVEYFHQHVATGFPRQDPYPTPAFQTCGSTCEECSADTPTPPLEARVALLESRCEVLQVRADNLEAELEVMREAGGGADAAMNGVISLLEGFIDDLNRYRKSLKSL